MSLRASTRPTHDVISVDHAAVATKHRPDAKASARLRHRVLGIGDGEVSFETRGFNESDASARRTLERHGVSFVAGFNSALVATDIDDLALRLLDISEADRGFAYEGSAMAFGVLDIVTPLRRDRLGTLLRSNHGSRHLYMLHVGAGWSLARLHLRPLAHLRGLDPFLRWLVVDGYGFHQGFFSPRRYVEGHATMRRLRGYEQHAFDQGLGRSMWFVVGGDVERAARCVDAFAQQRHGDLWSGLGLAATYTTAVDGAQLARLRELSGPHHPRLAQGAAFAVGARHRAGNVVPHTALAAKVLCDHSIEQIVEIVTEARADLRADNDGRAYEQWRERISEWLSSAPVLPR